MFRSSSVPAKVLKLLKSGKKLTPAQITKKFGVVNPHDPVYILAEAGYDVQRKYRQTRNGFKTVTYSMHVPM